MSDDTPEAIGARILDYNLARAARDDSDFVDLKIGADIQMAEIEWLWPGYLAGGKLHILGGAPGTGKTTIALSLAAALSSGDAWPDGSVAPSGDVLIWSGEDDPADTLIPRLVASGADLYRIYIVGSVIGTEWRRPFNPADDMPGLLRAARALENLKLLVIDPIVSAIKGDSHKNAETRRGLQPLVDFGAETGAAVLGITHLSKGTQGRDPLERLSGSLAFGATARLVFGAVCEPGAPGEPPERKFMRIKSNISADGGGYSYSLRYDDLGSGVVGGRVVWGDYFADYARDVFAKSEATSDDDRADRSAVDEAADWLFDYLGENQKSGAKQIYSEAKSAGHQERTLRYAKARLGVVSIKTSAGGWCWQFPRNSFSVDTGRD